MQEKELNIRSLGTTLIACFIGAALVSGKEIWQFFGIYGSAGIVGLVLSMLLLGTFTYMLLTVAQKSDITDMTRVLFRKDHPPLQLLIGILQAVFMLGVYVVMLSAAGALLKELFPALPGGAVIGAAILCVVVTLTVLTGVDGMIKIFSYATPFLVAVTVIIALCALSKYGGDFAIPAPQADAAPMLDNWFISALNFVSYNFFCAIGILASLGQRSKKRKVALGGSALGCGMLLILAIAIYVSLCTIPAVRSTELPMLALAGKLSPVLQYVYAVLLLLAMFSASVAVSVPLPDFIQNELHLRCHRKPLIVILSILAFIGSFCGFGTLIDYLYPMFGYLAFAALALLIYRFIRLR